ncbi:glutathione S-transferase family protein [Patescibacteria group bacterium]|jgi:glutathione S-transferase|nr:glutathione S-transferase family protein [Patescibacteria group bacterium]
MYKIYGSKGSGSASRCYWTAAEAGIELENVPLDFQKGEHKAEAYLKLNPNGKVPTLVDGDVVIWESLAINNYIVEKNKPELFGENDPASHAHLSQWSYWALAHLQKALEPLYMQKWTGAMSPEGVAAAQADSGKWLSILEKHMAGRDFIVGKTFTIADINVGSIIFTGKDYLDMIAFQNISRWLGVLAERPAYKQVYG